ncbi:M10 family metallopeptidase C-terminal domain-containing protein [Sulfitobacter sp. LCG007]
MCTLCQTLDPASRDGGLHTESLGATGSGASVGATLPVYSYDQIADYLTDGFWADKGQVTRAFNVQTGGTITVNFNALGNSGRDAALKALDAWSAVTGLTFQSSSNAQITFSENLAGAYNSSVTSGNTIISSSINIETGWKAYGDYYLQTYIHEIGHALGLGHGGDYNGSANFSTDAHYANDSWQTTVMSYFDQNQNPNTDASRLFLATAQMADVIAIQNLYGTPTSVRTGDSIYGDNQNTGQFGMDLPSNWAVCIYDNGGTDVINLGSRAYDQMLDMRAETYSNINGRIGNVSIGRGTIIENAILGAGDDFVNGNSAANRIEGGSGADTILGQGDNDVLIGGVGADSLSGGSGADRFVYMAMNEAGDTITDITIAGGDRIDLSGLLSAIGYSGSDPVADGIVSLQGGSGGSWLMIDADGSGAGAPVQLVFLTGIDPSAELATLIDVSSLPSDPNPGGNYDTVYTITDSFITAWTASRSVISDPDGGEDTLDLSAVSSGSRIDLTSGVIGKVGRKSFQIAGGTEIENLILTEFNDFGWGNERDNAISGGAGVDKLYGKAGNDTLSGGADTDRLYSGSGNDLLDGGDGDDQLYSEAGSDTMTGGLGNDKFYVSDGGALMDGGEGHDKFYGGDGDDTAIGGAGKDYIKGEGGNDLADGGDDDDKLYGADGDDTLSGGAGSDYLRGDDGADVMDGGADADRLYGGDGNDTMTGGDGEDYLRGDIGDDVLSGGGDKDKLYGNNGNDVMSGGGGNDYLNASNGDDQLMGGAGDDTLTAGNGDDSLSGDDGNDYLEGKDGNDVMDGGAGDDSMRGGSHDDAISGGDGNDNLTGDLGNDTLSGDAGDDTISAGSGDDLLRGGSGNDDLAASSGNDSLYGGTGEDTLDGGSGDDIICGGAGADTLVGGSGTDCFVFTGVAEIGDTITDFKARYGETIDISGLMSELGTTVASALSSGALGLSGDGTGSSWLEYDADGSGGAAALQIAYLRLVSDDTTLSGDWLV